MRITQDVRRHAGEEHLAGSEAIQHGLEQKGAEFAKVGDVYQKV